MSLSNPCSCTSVILVHVATGTLYPRDGQISKEQGKLVAKFGPLVSWSIAGKADSYQVLLKPQTSHHGCKALRATRQSSDTCQPMKARLPTHPTVTIGMKQRQGVYYNRSGRLSIPPVLVMVDIHAHVLVTSSDSQTAEALPAFAPCRFA